MKTCPKCHTTSIPDYAKYCPVCGKKMRTDLEIGIYFTLGKVASRIILINLLFDINQELLCTSDRSIY